MFEVVGCSGRARVTKGSVLACASNSIRLALRRRLIWSGTSTRKTFGVLLVVTQSFYRLLVRVRRPTRVECNKGACNEDLPTIVKRRAGCFTQQVVYSLKVYAVH
jgi:hypothetical protein